MTNNLYLRLNVVGELNAGRNRQLPIQAKSSCLLGERENSLVMGVVGDANARYSS